MPIPAIIAAFARSGTAVKELTGAMAKGGKQAMSFKDTVGKVTEAYNQASVAGYMMKSQVEGVFGTLAGSATMAAQAIKSMADPLTALTALSNPAAVKQFELAFADAMAVMGRVALPVVQALTRAMRIVGDMYARAEPFLLRVTVAMGAAIDKIFGKLETMSKGFGPMMEYASKAMTTVMKYVGWVFGLYAKVGSAVGSVFGEIYKHITNLIQIVEQLGIFEVIGFVIESAINMIILPVKAVAGALSMLGKAFMWFAKLIGFKFKEPTKLSDKSAYGSAVRSVNITDSGESVAKDAQTKAFMQAMQPAGAEPEKEIDVLGGIRDILGELRKYFTEFAKEAPDAIVAGINAAATSVINAIPGSQTAKSVIGGARSAADSGVFGIAGMLASAMTR